MKRAEKLRLVLVKRSRASRRASTPWIVEWHRRRRWCFSFDGALQVAEALGQAEVHVDARDFLSNFFRGPLIAKLLNSRETLTADEARTFKLAWRLDHTAALVLVGAWTGADSTVVAAAIQHVAGY